MSLSALRGALRGARRARSRRQAVMENLDTIFRGLLVIRSGGRCERCGVAERAWVDTADGPELVVLEVAHHRSRRIEATRWDYDNASVLCRRCHRWGHAHPAAFLEWWQARVGEPAVERLRELWKSPRRVDLWGVREDLLRRSLES